LLFSTGREARLIFGRQYLRAPQIVFGVNVLLLPGLFFASALLTRRFRGILRRLRAALRSAEKQARA